MASTIGPPDPDSIQHLFDNSQNLEPSAVVTQIIIMTGLSVRFQYSTSYRSHCLLVILADIHHSRLRSAAPNEQGIQEVSRFSILILITSAVCL